VQALFSRQEVVILTFNAAFALAMWKLL